MNPPVLEQPKSGDASAGGIRLNLGGRDTKISGFKTVDLHEGPTVDFVGDISKLSMFNSATVDEIYASHCLEHFPHPKTIDVLSEWRRVLKPGAKCFISVPDVDAAIRIIQKEGLTDFTRNLLWGDQGYDLAFHYAGFTYPLLARSLMVAGFRDVRRLKSMPYGVRDCSNLVDSYYKQPISLNVEAIA